MLRSTPEEMRGRVSNTTGMAAMALATLSPLAAGLLVEHGSGAWAMGFFAATMAVATALGLIMRGLREAESGPTAGSVRDVIIREARPDEAALIGELRVSAYRHLGLLPESSDYAETLRGFGFDSDSDSAGDSDYVVLVAADEADSVIGTITLELFGSDSELARDETEADVRAFAVAAAGQGQGVGRMLLLAVIEHAAKRGLRRLRLCTQPGMKAAQHLYTAEGFTRTPDLDWSPVPGLTLRAYERETAR